MDANLTNIPCPTAKLLSTEQLNSESPNKSWFLEVETHSRSDTMDKSKNVNPAGSKSVAVDMDANISVKDEYVLPVEPAELSRKSCEREIIVKFLDSSNEEKYERLLKEEKIKTPLKRRISSSRSNSPLEENETVKNADNESEPRILYAKKTRIDSEGGYIGHDHKQKIREIETDEGILSRRQKQIDYGKNTVGYDRYIQAVARDKRTPEDPSTPPKNIKYSRRAFDGLIKVWRKKLHCYDPEGANRSETNTENSA